MKGQVLFFYIQLKECFEKNLHLFICVWKWGTHTTLYMTT